MSALPNLKGNEQLFDLAAEQGEGSAALSGGLWFMSGCGSGKALTLKDWKDHPACSSGGKALRGETQRCGARLLGLGAELLSLTLGLIF